MISIWQERTRHGHTRWVAQCQAKGCTFSRASDVRSKAWNRVLNHIRDKHPDIATT